MLGMGERLRWGGGHGLPRVRAKPRGLLAFSLISRNFEKLWNEQLMKDNAARAHKCKSSTCMILDSRPFDELMSGPSKLSPV